MSEAILELNDFARIASEMEGTAGAVVEKTIGRIHQYVDASFSAPKHGATYRVNKDGPQHTASAPGEAPAIDTGNLANSIGERMTAPTTGEVDVGADYGIPLELGTSKMAPRPFLAPAVEKAWPEFVKAMQSLGS